MHAMLLNKGDLGYGVSCACNPFTGTSCQIVFGPVIDDGAATAPANNTIIEDPATCYSSCDFQSNPLYNYFDSDQIEIGIINYWDSLKKHSGDAFYALNLFRTDLKSFYGNYGFMYFWSANYLRDERPQILYSEALHNHLQRIANAYYCNNGTLIDPSNIVNDEFSHLSITYYSSGELITSK